MQNDTNQRKGTGLGREASKTSEEQLEVLMHRIVARHHLLVNGHGPLTRRTGAE